MSQILEETSIKNKKVEVIEKPSNLLFIFSSIKVYLIVLIINAIILLPAFFLSSNENNKENTQGLLFLFWFPFLAYVAFAMYLPFYSAFLIFGISIINTLKYKPHRLLAVTTIIFSTLAIYYGNNIILFGYSLSQQTKRNNVSNVKEKPIKIVLINESFNLAQSIPSYQATYKIINNEKKSGKLRINCEVFKLIETPSHSEIILSSLGTTINIMGKDEVVNLNSPINFGNTKRQALISDNKNIYTRCFMDLSSSYGFGTGSKSTSWPFQLITIDPNVKQLNWQQVFTDNIHFFDNPL